MSRSGSVFTDASKSNNSDVASIASSGFGSTVNSQENIRQAHLIRDIENGPVLRQVLYEKCNGKNFGFVLLAVIILNTLVLGLQTVEELKRLYGWYFSICDNLFLGIYVMECMFKLYVWRLQYFWSGWNNFDLFIVLSSLFTFLLPIMASATTNINSEIFRLLRLFRAVRAIRSLRVLRTIAFMKSLQVVVATLLRSLPAMGNICILTLLVLYIYTVIGKTLFGATDHYHFGSVGTSAWTLFQLTTLDDWSRIYTMNKYDIPGIFFFMASYIILFSFVFINLFVAVILSNLQSTQNHAKKKKTSTKVAAAFEEGNYNVEAAEKGTHDDISNSSATEDPDVGELEELLIEELGIDNYYSANMPLSNKEDLTKYFMLLATLERNINLYQQQQKILDDLVDLVQQDSTTD